MLEYDAAKRATLWPMCKKFLSKIGWNSFLFLKVVVVNYLHLQALSAHYVDFVTRLSLSGLIGNVLMLIVLDHIPAPDH